MSDDPRYLHSRERWLKFRDYCLTQRELGFDTEFDETSIAVWSLAIYSKAGITPRGYNKARGFVLPLEALEDFRPVLESESVAKWAHNAVADTKSVGKHGIVARSVYDTLSWIRVARPGLPKNGLKYLANVILGKPERPGFLEVLGYKAPVTVTKKSKHKECSCGIRGCKKRKGHTRLVVETETAVTKFVPAVYSVHEVKPGHERWDAWVDYALEDAVDSLELASFLSMARDRLTFDPLAGQLVEKEIRDFLRYYGT